MVRKMKPFSQACANNKQPILNVIAPLLADKKSLLEIGSGTGQHAVYFAEKLPHLFWQTSDQEENHSGINQWLDDANLSNIGRPMVLDVQNDRWPSVKQDAIYSANTAHIMSWEMVESMFSGIGNSLAKQGLFILYGPFNYQGKFTSESNERFEQWLKGIDSKRGIRDFEAIDKLANNVGLSLLYDFEMPANNRLLVWEAV